jgi:murein L,D-transpeptidase YcbB/YkuD
MNQNFKYCCFIIVLLFLSIHVNTQNRVEDIIKTKIENSNFNSIIIDNQIIHCKKPLSLFYQNRLYQPVWESSKILKSFTKELDKAYEEGLNPNDYHFETIQKLIEHDSTSVQRDAELDLLLTDAFFLYTSHLLKGKVDFQKMVARWSIDSHKDDIIELLQKSILNNSTRPILDGLKPNDKIYTGLKKALQNYSKYQENGGWKDIPSGISIKYGASDSRIPFIRKRLVATKDISKIYVNNSDVYDKNLFEAVQRFQLRHSMDSAGEITKNCLEQMNVSVDDRIDEIKINMDRWRQSSQELGPYYLKVNIPDFTLEVIKNRKIERVHKVIVGRIDRKTPTLNSTVTNLIFNPTWVVPPGILSADILPSVRKNINYLKAKNIIIYNNKGTVINPRTINFYSSSAKSYSYVQSPGPNNSLGAVKFVFPNNYTVYLHDTPSKELFKKSQRTFSSGCIRVENPLELAAYLLNDPINWNLTNIKKITHTRKTQTVLFKNQLTIHVIYLTTWTDSDGIVQFRNDIYNKNIKYLRAFKKPAPTLNKLRKRLTN